MFVIIVRPLRGRPFLKFLFSIMLRLRRSRTLLLFSFYIIQFNHFFFCPFSYREQREPFCFYFHCHSDRREESIKRFLDYPWRTSGATPAMTKFLKIIPCLCLIFCATPSGSAVFKNLFSIMLRLRRSRTLLLFFF